MATKKKAAKLVPKKPAAKKITKKSAPKLSPISKVKGKLSKVAPKKTAPKLTKPTPKASAKKLTVKPKVVLSKPPKLVQRPLSKVGAKPAPKAAAAKKNAGATKPKKHKDPSLDYRMLRKYTAPALEKLVEDVAGIRATIKSDGGDSPLAAWELIDFLKASENVIPEWKLKKMPPPDGKPRKKGRPSKEDLAARAGAVKPLQKNQAAAAIAKVRAVAAKAGVPAKLSGPGFKPVTNGVAKPRPVIKLVRPAAN